MPRVVIVIIFIVLHVTSFAQVSPLEAYSLLDPIYSNFTTADGLPQAYVACVVQDQYGFMWVGTLAGLARFDGNEFRKFTNTTEGSSQLSTPRIMDLWFDGVDKLWIMHFNHRVDVMDTKTYVVTQNVNPIKTAYFDSFPLSVSSKSSTHRYFTVDRRENNWLLKVQDQYLLYDSTNTKMRKIFDQIGPPRSIIHAFEEDELGRMWKLTDQGLQVSDQYWENFKQINFPMVLGLKNEYHYNKSILIRLPRDRMLFALGQRLFIYDEGVEIFREIHLPKIDAVVEAQLLQFTFDGENRFVFEYRGFVCRLEDDESVSVIWEHPERDKFLIADLYIDQSEVLWVSVNSGGLYTVDLLTQSQKLLILTGRIMGFL
ncbi:MAG: hypothetical protein ACI8QD_001047 [Cyclobacteriaceae bacterium]|jgi:hypothetical protein